jgi:hypothetical protein
MADAMTGATLAGRVKRGAALLDEKRPGWAGRIALDRLAMGSCSACVLGQIFGGFDLGVHALRQGLSPRISVFEHEPTWDWSGEQGFSIPLDQIGDVSDREQYKRLADLWRAEVRARTTEAPPCST